MDHFLRGYRRSLISLICIGGVPSGDRPPCVYQAGRLPGHTLQVADVTITQARSIKETMRHLLPPTESVPFAQLSEAGMLHYAIRSFIIVTNCNSPSSRESWNSLSITASFALETLRQRVSQESTC